MKIFSASQIRRWDQFTIENEPVSSIDLMERAAQASTDWILQNFDAHKTFIIFCGKGNNGGDGLAIARLLMEKKVQVKVWIAGSDKNGSDDFVANFERLEKITDKIYFIASKDALPKIDKSDILIDALFGTGLNKRPSGIFSELIHHFNKSGVAIVSIDMPSGMYADESSKENDVVKASHTISFQVQKLSFLMAENEAYTGKIEILDIGLNENFSEKEKTNLFLTCENLIKNIYQPRKKFSNKGNYGYACLVAGSYGMMGAAVLSSMACLRSGVGKLTCYISKDGYEIMQTSVPEAMCKTFGKTFIKDIKNVDDFDVIGIGPGIGKHTSHKQLLETVLRKFGKPIVIDADGLNSLSTTTALYKEIPENSIITPHPKEFERLFGETKNNFEQMQLALSKAQELKIYIVLKGHHTLIATPDEHGYFNSTGNAGMATAGSGDVLTGIITGLLAQQYSSLNACILGVYLHGFAGDLAAEKLSKESMLAGDMIDYLGAGFLHFEKVSST
ncbi:MAG: NAD(P)H-hydrate dehydratase [Ginsengibacter sp.]